MKIEARSSQGVRIIWPQVGRVLGKVRVTRVEFAPDVKEFLEVRGRLILCMFDANWREAALSPYDPGVAGFFFVIPREEFFEAFVHAANEIRINLVARDANETKFCERVAQARVELLAAHIVLRPKVCEVEEGDGAQAATG